MSPPLLTIRRGSDVTAIHDRALACSWLEMLGRSTTESQDAASSVNRPSCSTKTPRSELPGGSASDHSVSGPGQGQKLPPSLLNHRRATCRRGAQCLENTQSTASSVSTRRASRHQRASAKNQGRSHDDAHTLVADILAMKRDHVGAQQIVAPGTAADYEETNGLNGSGVEGLPVSSRAAYLDNGVQRPMAAPDPAADEKAKRSTYPRGGAPPMVAPDPTADDEEGNALSSNEAVAIKPNAYGGPFCVRCGIPYKGSRTRLCEGCSKRPRPLGSGKGIFNRGTSSVSDE